MLNQLRYMTSHRSYITLEHKICYICWYSKSIYKLSAHLSISSSVYQYCTTWL